MARLVRVVALVLGLGALGALAGVAWERIWDAPKGIVFKGVWYLQPAGPDFGFDSVATYVMIGFSAALVAGVLVGALLVGRELWTLLGVFLGCVLAAWLMFVTGQRLGPPDPQVLAAHTEDLARLPARLDIGEGVRLAPFGSTAALAWPLGGVLGAGVTMLVTDGRPARRRRPQPDAVHEDVPTSG